ncbi:MAG TPA: HAMP domain-containing sensor histidine kinase [Candidatus Baltobacteraceae bacterium]|nr:HAMP domain-containing sensor histidine kinase [Candidatus Baltobacteraceae bacterium]
MSRSFATQLRKHIRATIAVQLFLVGFVIAALGYVVEIQFLMQAQSSIVREIPQILGESNSNEKSARAITETILTREFHPGFEVVALVNHTMYKGRWYDGPGPRYAIEPTDEFDTPFSIRPLGLARKTSMWMASLAGYRGLQVSVGSALIDTDASAVTIARCAERLGAMLTIALFLSILLANIAAGRLSKRALAPLYLVLEELESFARGDLRPRRIETTRNDELGRLASAYNDAVETVDRALAERARAENQMRQFMADAAHQLRTPLTVLRGFIGILRRGDVKSPRDIPRILDTMDRQSAAMAALIKQLMLLQEWVEEPLDAQPLDAGKLVREVVAPLADANPGRDVRIEVRASARAKIPRDEITYALTNLVDNALKYAPDGPIVVSVDRDDGHVVITVSDHGPGISGEQLERIFDRFYRGERRDVPGSGLGLAIAKRAVERAKGTLTVQTRPGSGTSFVIVLPEFENGTEPIHAPGDPVLALKRY